ncbi:MAG: FG-GAP-like repeat-containing protein, partial [Longimicrobiales bacterium]
MQGHARRWVAFAAVAALALSARGVEAAPQGAEGGSDGPRVLFQLPEFILLDQGGEVYGTEQLRGTVYIANFIFTRCKTVCPLTTNEMRTLQSELRADPKWADIRLVSFSVDPEHDRPDVLKAFAETNEADTSHWKFLTGSQGQLWWLIQKGFKLPVGDAPENTEMPIFHSRSFVLVDQEGRMRGMYDPLESAEHEKLVRDLQTVLAEPGPTVVHLPSEEAITPPWVDVRREAQLATAEGIAAEHDFRFTDQIAESGITFVHGVTDDSGRLYKPVHYDHGSGISIADVDGDGKQDVLFINQVGSNELWRNLGGGRFENITERSGLGRKDAIGVGAAFADTDNDGDPDVYLTSVRGGNVLFENDGSGHFTNITEAAGLEYSGHSSGALFFDYDRDGRLDLFLSNVGVYTTQEQGRGGYYIAFPDAFSGHLKPARSEESRLYRNLGENRFKDVTYDTGLLDLSWSGDATPLDANGDGWLDIYLLNMQGHDQYYENNEGKDFMPRSREVFPKTPWGSMGVKAFDFDNDGDQDLILSDMHSDMSEPSPLDREKLKSRMQWPESYLNSGGQSIFGNAFYRNDGDGRYTEISDEIGTENYWPWGLSVGDLNADGFEDVFIASAMNYPFSYGVNTLLLNEAGRRFADAEYILGVEPRRNNRTTKPWFELDCSGEDKEDLLVCKRYGFSGRVVVWGAVGSRSSVIFDLDDDGDLDIVTLEFGDAPMVLISDLAQRKPVRY